MRIAVQNMMLRSAQLQQAVLEQSMKECTFKPTTNEGAKREIIDKLLSSDSAQFCL